MVRRPPKQQNKPPANTKSSKIAPSPTRKAKSTVPKNSTLTWENIVLYYLSKLKGFWRPIGDSCNKSYLEKNHPDPGKQPTAVDLHRINHINYKRESLKQSKKLMEPYPNRYTSHCNDILRRRRSITSVSSVSRCGTSTTSIREARNTKAAKIVSAAIDYGCATGIIRNNGKYFWFKNTRNNTSMSRSPTPQKAITRAPTPALNNNLCRLCLKANSVACKRRRLPSMAQESLLSVCDSATVNVPKKLRKTRPIERKQSVMRESESPVKNKRSLRSATNWRKTQPKSNNFKFGKRKGKN